MAKRDLPPPELQEAIAFLDGLSEDRFSDALATYIMVHPDDEDDVFGMDSPDPVTREVAAAAFRSAALIVRSVAAAKFLNTKAQEAERENAGTKKAAGLAHYRAKVSRERSILESKEMQYRAEAGTLNTKPNPTRRAEARLATENRKGPVAASRIIELIREEEAKDRNAAAARREARAAERKVLRRSR